MKKEREKEKELREQGNHMTMTVQHEDRFSPPQVKN